MHFFSNSPVPKIHFSSNGHIKREGKKREGKKGEGEREKGMKIKRVLLHKWVTVILKICLPKLSENFKSSSNRSREL